MKSFLPMLLVPLLLVLLVTAHTTAWPYNDIGATAEIETKNKSLTKLLNFFTLWFFVRSPPEHWRYFVVVVVVAANLKTQKMHKKGKQNFKETSSVWLV